MTIAAELTPPRPDGWSVAEGTDDYGRWSILRVAGVEQRMRWIEPGTFTMGSPDDEPGRSASEGPQHEVTLTQGFWLADTPCTQELWEAVMGSNPSRFQGLRRPVERVSWEDVQTFLGRLRARLGRDALEVGLPSEAQWEYACRAGSSGASYAKHRGASPDAIAWCAGTVVDRPARSGKNKRTRGVSTTRWETYGSGAPMRRAATRETLWLTHARRARCESSAGAAGTTRRATSGRRRAAGTAPATATAASAFGLPEVRQASGASGSRPAHRARAGDPPGARPASPRSPDVGARAPDRIVAPGDRFYDIGFRPVQP